MEKRQGNTAKRASVKFAEKLPDPVSRAELARTRQRVRAAQKKRQPQKQGLFTWIAFVVLAAALSFAAFTMGDKLPPQKQTLNRIAPSITPAPSKTADLPPISISTPEAKTPRPLPENPTPKMQNTPFHYEPRRTASAKNQNTAKKQNETRVATNTVTRPVLSSTKTVPSPLQEIDENKDPKASIGKIALQTLPGGLIIRVNGKIIGTSASNGAFKYFDVKPGPHTIAVSPTELGGVRYAGYERRIYVEQAKVTSIGLIRLLPLRTLTLNIAGQGVTVRVNEESYALGGKPLTLNIPEGKIEIRARAANGKIFEKIVPLKGDNLTLNVSLE
jgi:hypothetical protein